MPHGAPSTLHQVIVVREQHDGVAGGDAEERDESHQRAEREHAAGREHREHATDQRERQVEQHQREPVHLPEGEPQQHQDAGPGEQRS